MNVSVNRNQGVVSPANRAVATIPSPFRSLGLRMLSPVVLLACVVGLMGAASVRVAYHEKFEDGHGDYVAEPTGAWAWDVPTTGPRQAHSAPHVWATNPHGDYNANTDAYLISPPIDLSGYADHEFGLIFWQFLITEADYDFVTTEVSRDGGGNWVLAYGPVSGEVSTDWALQTVRLGPEYGVANFRVRFRLVSDASENLPGVYLDDIVVLALPLGSGGGEPLTIFEDTFEDDAGGFLAGSEPGKPTSWEWGPPTGALIAARSGDHVWGTQLEGLYGNGEDGYVISPRIDLSAYAGQSLRLSWWQILATEFDADFAQVEISRDDGLEWTTLYGPVSGAVSEAWANEAIWLDSASAGPDFRFRFRLRSDESLGQFGFYVDDVDISLVPDGPPRNQSFGVGVDVNGIRRFDEHEYRSRFEGTTGLAVVRIVALPAQGILSLGRLPVLLLQDIPADNLGLLSYRPTANYRGTDNFEWTGRDLLGFAPESARVEITVAELPVAGSDSFQVLQNTSLCLPFPEILLNDYARNRERLQIQTLPLASDNGGELRLFGRVLYFSPPVDFVGLDSFGYTAVDRNGAVATGRVSITVKGVEVNQLTQPTATGTDNVYHQRLGIANPVTEPTGGTVYSLELTFTNLPTGVSVKGADNATPDGWPVLLHTTSLGPGQSEELILTYNVEEGHAPPDPVELDTRVLPPTPSVEPTGPAYILHADTLDDNSVRLEFEAVLGGSYRIEQSSDLQTWIATSEVIEAGLQRMQWIDDSDANDDGGGMSFFRVMTVAKE